MTKKARFVVFEGVDLAGKGTMLDRAETFLRLHGADLVRYREPGGTKVGERIREILLDKTLGVVTSRCELALFVAARAQLLDTQVLPALRTGQVVILDRYYFSSAAYQGPFVGGVNHAINLNEDWFRFPEPDLVVYLDGDPEVLARRARGEKDRIEEKGLEFQKQVRDAYLKMADHRRDLFVTVNAERPIEDVWKDVQKILEDRVLEEVVRG